MSADGKVFCRKCGDGSGRLDGPEIRTHREALGRPDARGAVELAAGRPAAGL